MPPKSLPSADPLLLDISDESESSDDNCRNDDIRFLSRRNEDKIPNRIDADSLGRRRKRIRLRKAWMRYKRRYIRDSSSDDPLYGGKQISGDHLRAFLIWLCRSKKGLLGEKITVKTLINDFESLARDVEDVTGTAYTKSQRVAWKECITRELRKAEGLSTQGRPKPLADGAVVDDILQFLWRDDEYHYNPPRMRIQVALSLCIIRYMGLRPGDFLESQDWQGSNEGILWKDCAFLMVPGTNGGPQWKVRITVRNRKNEKDYKKGPPPVENFQEDPANRWRCPVCLLLALAISDNALEDISCALDLDRVRFDPNCATRTLKFREESLNQPVIRRRLQGRYANNIASAKILTGSQLAQLFGDLGQRAGYSEPLTPYSVRRGFANGIDKHLTEAERIRHLGHQNGITMQYYLSSGAPSDVQNILNGQVPDQAMIDSLRSMIQNVDRSAPRPGRSSLETGRYRSVQKQQEGLTRVEEHLQQRIKHFSAPRNIYEGHATHVPLGKSLPRPEHSTLFRTYLRYDKERSNVIAEMFSPLISSASHLVGALTSFVDPSPWYYPYSRPESEYCWCGKLLSTCSQDHVLACYLRTESSRQGTDEPACTHFCYYCAEYYSGTLLWDHHCAQHLDLLDKNCGQVSRNGITLRPALCPFCLGNSDAGPSERFQQFATRNVYLRHIERHLQRIGINAWPLECPHPLCKASCADIETFWTHLEESHGLAPAQLCGRAGLSGQSSGDSLDGLTENVEVACLEDGVSDASSAWSSSDNYHCKTTGCESAFTDLEDFFKHVALHVGKWCPIQPCQEYTRDLAALRWHLCRQHNLSQHICRLNSLTKKDLLCGKAFMTAKRLKEHEDMHERKLKLTCATCSRSFEKMETLERHQLADHEGENPWRCSAAGCPKRYAARNSLKRHIESCHHKSMLSGLAEETEPENADDGRSHALFTGIVEGAM